jgi:periplasmic protein TonB
MEDQREKKNQKIAWVTTVGVHGLILLLLLFLVAWQAPNPPLPEIGIELNFGFDQQGSGDVQPETPVGAPEQEEQAKPTPEETAPEIIEEIQPEEVEEIVPEVTQKLESPVVIKEEKKVEDKPVEKPKEKPIEKPVEAKPIEKPKINPETVYKPTTESKTEGTATDKPGTAGNQGDDEGKTGDKGDPKGSLDANALYGKQGGGGGGISMSGFNGFEWPKVEAPSLPEEAYGVYEFIVKVDDQGYVTSVVAAQRGLSLEAEKRLKAQIQKLQFIPKGSNLPESSEGRITFKVVSK